MSLLYAEMLLDDAALDALAPSWAALWDRCADATPFQHPAWLLSWWRVFGTSRPRVALLRDAAGRLLCVLPLYELPNEGKVLPIGTGLSDYFDALVAPDAPPDAAAVLLERALSRCELPCHLPDLPPGARLRGAASPGGWRDRMHETEPCPVLAIGGVPSRQRRKLRMSRHRAARIGGHVVRRAEAAALAAMFAQLVRLHGACWGERRQPGVLADPRVRAFHELALPRLHAAGLLRLRALDLGGATAAVVYALQAPRRMFCYLSGFDPRFAFASPGTLLLGDMLDEAAAERLMECHFLRGAEPYKYAWGATDRGNALRVLEPA